LSAISRAVIDIGVALRTGNKGFGIELAGTKNTFGDE